MDLWRTTTHSLETTALITHLIHFPWCASLLDGGKSGAEIPAETVDLSTLHKQFLPVQSKSKLLAAVILKYVFIFNLGKSIHHLLEA